MTTPAVTTAAAVPSDTKEFGIVAKLAAEAFGTFLLVFGGLGVALFSNPSSAPLPAPLAIGLSIAVSIAAFGHISGGHFNPAVTLGTAVAGRTPWRRVPGYIVAQLVGGAIGALILWIAVKTLPGLSNVQTIFTQLSNGVDSLSPNKFPMAAGLLAEVVATAAFLAIILAATSKRAAKGVAPWAIGLGLAILVQAIAPITNASLNPARSTATVIFAEPTALGQLWIFWVAPLLGAAIAGLIFRGFGSPEDVIVTGAPGAPSFTTVEGEPTPGITVAEEEEASGHGSHRAERQSEAADGEPTDAALGKGTLGEGAEVHPTAETPGSDEDDAKDFFDKNK
ncbi:aquaporin [Sinomonas terrae]|uniref:Aquaporin n=1 Tax=Sinomonas terrae TaxID=2908838 RepID=A0ABS9TZV0_9MICC|nr:aquaporin [Sinomonas terrae]MCH6469787.1 aquaporin [Sinomonas terrae]